MGQKVNPHGLRVGVIKDWDSRWYARNLFTITPFEGYDPEPDKNLVQFNYPNTRQFVIGAELTF